MMTERRDDRRDGSNGSGDWPGRRNDGTAWGAVIGGLAAATLATLIVLPSIFSLVQQSAGVASASLDPDEPQRTQPG
jgi:hypothetical protein